MLGSNLGLLRLRHGHLAARRSNHSARYHPHSARSHHVVWIIIVFLGHSYNGPLAYLAGICGSALPATHQASPLNLYLGATHVNTGASLKNREQNNAKHGLVALILENGLFRHVIQGYHVDTGVQYAV